VNVSQCKSKKCNPRNCNCSTGVVGSDAPLKCFDLKLKLFLKLVSVLKLSLIMLIKLSITTDIWLKCKNQNVVLMP
jgi:hypothetical protein